MVKMINFLQTGRAVMGPYPVIRKQGFISFQGGEPTPFVFRDRLLWSQMEWNRTVVYDDSSSHCGCGMIYDMETGLPVSTPFAAGKRFATVYVDHDTVYGFSTYDNVVYRHVSHDLQHWEDSVALTFPDNFATFNTSVCFGDGAYHMVIECDKSQGKENDHIGQPFTLFFAHSQDLETWELAPFEDAFATDRYCACPTWKYANGWYYMIALEAMPFYRFFPYIYRSRDFQTWEVGAINPVMWCSEEDRHPVAGRSFEPAQLKKAAEGMDANLSDVELCEWNGNTYILYATGNQWSNGGVVCEAIYEGTMTRFLESFF